MKQRDLLLGLCMMTGGAAFAASPYTGTSPEEAFANGGKYYLYQVETGKWLQTNRHDNGDPSWTTHAELGGIGFDIELRRPENFEKGYQIFCSFTNNGELNGSDEDRFFLDQGDRKLTEWIFEPSGEGYKIKVEAYQPENPDRENRDGIKEDTYIGSDESNTFGGLSDDPTQFTWQLVSREERIAKMKEEAAKNGSADATFLLPWNERGRNDLRDREWSFIDINSYGGGQDNTGGNQYYPVTERWHRIDHKASITLTDIPNGTYSFTVQGFYRDEDIDWDNTRLRAGSGNSIKAASYFAGSESGVIKSIFDDAKTEAQEGFPHAVDLIDEDYIVTSTVYVPNSMNDAGVAFSQAADVDVADMNTPYMNAWISAGVPDGSLTVGVEKHDTEREHDWFIYKRMYLRYDGEQVKGEDISGLQAQLQALIDEAANLYQSDYLVNAVNEAKDILATAQSSSTLIPAIDALQQAINRMNESQAVIDNYFATTAFYKDAEAQAKFDAAQNRGDYENALTTLRYARRRAAAEKIKDIYEGVSADDLKKGGDFYLYNVGQQQFLSGGSDWGAHAALAVPGIVVTLEPEEGVEDGMSFYINTHLRNGGDDASPNQYLNYRGYGDCAIGDDFYFQPVEGKPGVYNILQNDYRDVHMAWNPWASVDAGQGDETTVGTENRDLDPNDLNAQWKVISAAERLAALDKASVDNPVDASFLIDNPGFNQRMSDEGWITSHNAPDGDDRLGYGIWERGGNHNDFAWEYWNAHDFELNQTIYDVPEGVYIAEVQALYRNGHHDMQATKRNDTDNNNLVTFYAGMDETPIANILDYMNLCPGEGEMADDVTTELQGDQEVEVAREHVGEVPRYVPQVLAWFHAGFYKNQIVFQHDGGPLFLGLYKDEQANNEDWVVVDNFRLKYYGKNTTVDEVLSGVEDITIDEADANKDNRIFNLNGIEVKNPTVPGIYIQNGKKFIVK
ncbi:MAG: hypothetical protein HDS54_04085 [Barnesiella sp.]|nr:hypothetical protein [Barnesiella sp.]